MATGKTGTVEKDKEEIRRHIDWLFKAYIRRDLDAIRRGHTADWIGFQTGTRRLVRGIEQYMEEARATLKNFKATGYEMLDMDIQVQGDIAIVFYLAKDLMDDPSGVKKSALVRSVDIYRREATGWNQCGSNICVLPGE